MNEYNYHALWRTKEQLHKMLVTGFDTQTNKNTFSEGWLASGTFAQGVIVEGKWVTGVIAQGFVVIGVISQGFVAVGVLA